MSFTFVEEKVTQALLVIAAVILVQDNIQTTESALRNFPASLKKKVLWLICTVEFIFNHSVLSIDAQCTQTRPEERLKWCLSLASLYHVGIHYRVIKKKIPVCYLKRQSSFANWIPDWKYCHRNWSGGNGYLGKNCLFVQLMWKNYYTFLIRYYFNLFSKSLKHILSSILVKKHVKGKYVSMQKLVFPKVVWKNEFLFLRNLLSFPRKLD